MLVKHSFYSYCSFIQGSLIYYCTSTTKAKDNFLINLNLSLWLLYYKYLLYNFFNNRFRLGFSIIFCLLRVLISTGQFYLDKLKLDHDIDKEAHTENEQDELCFKIKTPNTTLLILDSIWITITLIIANYQFWTLFTF